MEECKEAGNSPVVPRALAPHAPRDSVFPSVPRMEHDWFCEKDLRRTECSCGLFQLRQDRGDFVRYNADICQVTHPTKGPKLAATIDNPDLFIKLLAEKTAGVDMAHFDRED